MESETRIFRQLSLFRGGINVTDQIFLAKYLSLMLRSGVNLLKAVDILAADFSKPAVKLFLGEMRETLQRGQPLWVFLGNIPRRFLLFL